MTTSNMIFVSHSTQDKAIVGQLCDELQLLGADVWVSFRNLPPGKPWDREIQMALEASSHVIVATSSNSINSDYVRAEVEYALSEGKQVIPVIIGEGVHLPLRWYTLQRFDWKDRSTAGLMKLVEYLPRNNLMRLHEYLNRSDAFDDLKKLLYKYPTWVHQEARANLDRHKRIQSDFHYFTTDTGGVFRYFCYLASPYEHPFDEQGNPSISIQQVLKLAMQDTKPGIDTRLLGQNVMEVVLYASRRDHYTNTMYQLRDKLQDAWIDHQLKRIKLITAARVRLDLKIASYDRLLDQLQRGAKTNGHSQ